MPLRGESESIALVHSLRNQNELRDRLRVALIKGRSRVRVGRRRANRKHDSGEAHAALNRTLI
jgi:hypothetical protein